jgi:hypothetical protein
MNRRVVDQLLISLGVIVTLVLLVGGGLAWLGYNFAHSQINSQLVQEKIYFPTAGSAALDLQQYAGQPVDSGDKAKAYADQFIWHHMMKASGGKTYAEVSTLAMASPTDAKLAALKNTLFQGDMLRSSLLTAYAFSRFGVIAYWSMVLCLAGAATMIILVILGLIHLNWGKPNSRPR